MAQDVVVKENLSETMVRDGAALVQKLDETDWNVSSAFWFYFPDANAWRLQIASPEISLHGAREAYTKIQDALKNTEPSIQSIALDDIGVMVHDHPLVGLLGSFIHTGPGIGNIRLSKNVINGHFIDDALIYRIS